MKEELSRNPENWKEKPKKELIDFIISQFHLSFKERLPKLLFFADKVENVHSENEDCPRGLASVLQNLSLFIIDHIKHDEENLFSLLSKERSENADSFIESAKNDYTNIKEQLKSIRHIVNDYKTPAGACGTWTFLYQQLEILEKDIEDYINLEENILFS
ncbi:MAG: hemerythrin domain-containing protein [Spirochaetia bacterium]|nr:hemerythrin domain-containing protein [Spirochaetia bacterium]